MSTCFDFSPVYHSLKDRYIRVGSNACAQWCKMVGCCSGPFYTPGQGDVRLPIEVVNPPDPTLSCPRSDENLDKGRCKVYPGQRPKYAKKTLGIPCTWPSA